MILEEKSKIFIFSLQYKSLISLNQGQGSIFKLRECAQSIFRLEITLKSRFLEENRKKNHVGCPPPSCRRAPINVFIRDISLHFFKINITCFHFLFLINDQLSLVQLHHIILRVTTSFLHF